MTILLQQAWHKVSQLPVERQDDIAEFLFRIVERKEAKDKNKKYSNIENLWNQVVEDEADVEVLELPNPNIHLKAQKLVELLR